MGPTAVPVIVNTLVWFVAGAILPWFVPKGENRGIVQTMMVLTSVCCYVLLAAHYGMDIISYFTGVHSHVGGANTIRPPKSWLGPYMMQYHPIIGPQLDPTAVHVMNEEWK